MALKQILETVNKVKGNFNRIINLTLYTDLGLPFEIKCPTKGRKPNIEINGSFVNQSEMQAFNITIKNLYLNLITQNYVRVRVQAGYEGNMVAFEGRIFSLYQESPGPEGSTVIQCKYGKIEDFIDGMVQVNYAPGALLRNVLLEISKKIQTTGVHTGLAAGALVLKEPLQYDGSARGLINRLQQLYADEELSIFVRGNELCAISEKGGDFVNAYTLQYLSAPPQPSAGGQDGTAYMTLTAPWDPRYRRGDLLTVPARVYMKNLTLVNSQNNKTQTILITALSFHFATTGSANSMTVQGPIKRK